MSAINDKRRRSGARRNRRVGHRPRVVLVLGGARSGKSRYAGCLAEAAFRHPLYLATAEACDEEMAERIRLHQKARGPRWQCVEEPLNVAAIIADPPSGCDGILLECLTVWLTNVLLKEGEAACETRRDALMRALQNPGCPIVLVSNEVGMGVVPEHALGRRFRDLAGWLNQAVAAVADEVVFVAAGIPLVLKATKRKR